MITPVSCTWNRGSRNFCAAVGWFVGLFPSSAGCLGLSGRWNRWKRQREKRKIGKRKVVMGIRSIDHEIKKDFLIDVWYLRYFEIGLRLNQMTYGRSPSSFTKWTLGWLHLGIKPDEYQSYEVSDWSRWLDKSQYVLIQILGLLVEAPSRIYPSLHPWVVVAAFSDWS